MTPVPTPLPEEEPSEEDSVPQQPSLAITRPRYPRYARDYVIPKRYPMDQPTKTARLDHLRYRLIQPTYHYQPTIRSATVILFKKTTCRMDKKLRRIIFKREST